METLLIETPGDHYPVYIGNRIRDKMTPKIKKDRTFLITDTNLARMYPAEINTLSHPSRQYIVSPGEEGKTMENAEKVINFMAEKNTSRDFTLFAFGGGVVGDLGGFCASIYMRGIEYVQMPTSLLAQVDSSVGGKTGVNLSRGKNLVGTFYHPERVIIDIDFLQTLPKRELKGGLAEVIKYGVIGDYDFFCYLQKNINRALELEEKTLIKIIKKSCQIKASIVSQDEKESGLRKILNFGHTTGHALEALYDYRDITHGEAVLEGMLLEGKIALRLGLIEEDYYDEICRLILRISGEIFYNWKPRDLLEKMLLDKKNRKGKISFLLPCARGEVREFSFSPRETKRLLKGLRE